MAFPPDGAVIASGDYDDMVHLWETSTGREIRCLDVPDEGTAVGIAYCADGQLLTVNRHKCFISVSHPNTGRLVQRLWKVSDEQWRMAFRPDGKRLAISAGDTIRIWNTGTWKERLRLGVGQDSVWSMAFTPDGAFLVTASDEDTAIRLWDLGKAREVRRLQGHQGKRCLLAVSPDGRWLASAGQEGDSIILWKLRTIPGRRIPGASAPSDSRSRAGRCESAAQGSG